MRKGTQAKKHRQLGAWNRFRIMTPDELYIMRGYNTENGDHALIEAYRNHKAIEERSLLRSVWSDHA